MMLENVSKTILLVDDDPDDAGTAKSALESAGVANPVIHVSDGDEAIAYLRGVGRYADRQQFPVPGIILLDLKMRRVDGFEVLSWLDTREERKKLLLIVLSGHGELQNIKRAYDLGANSFLMKPFQVADIHNLIKVHRQFWDLSPASGQVTEIKPLVTTQWNETTITKPDTSSRAQPNV